MYIIISGLIPAFYFIWRCLIITRRNQPEDLVNQGIKFKELLVIGPEGEQLGVMMRREALETAESYNLDLLCVAPGANPPVCKILDYGKHRFEAQKKLKEAKRNQHQTEVKPLRLSPVIDTHDFETKLNQAKKWLSANMKVKVDMRFRGRLITRQEVGRKVMNEFIEKCDELGTVEKKPNLEGNIMSCVITPKKK